MRAAIATAACLLALGSAATAQAAQRYASPSGTGEACTQPAPCSLETAVGKAQSNDEVIVTAGSYEVGGGVKIPFSASHVDIHGDPSGPMPTISSPSSPAIIQATGSAGNRLAYLRFSLKGQQTALTCADQGRVERMIVTGTVERAAGIAQYDDCLVRDSLVRLEGKESIAVTVEAAVNQWTAPMRNVTAIATGAGSIGVYSEFLFVVIGPGSQTADLRNVIAHGDEVDLQASPGLEGDGKIVVSHSNFVTVKQSGEATVTDAGGNQTAPPLFVDPGNGDYREAAGSPTIDAGVVDQLGATDLAGNPRIVGAAPDIGAYEFVPPAPPVVPPGRIQSLAIAPRAFRAANLGGAIASRKKTGGAPVGATVSYALSAGANVGFSVERKTVGRSVKGKCVKKKRANAAKRKCGLFKPVKGGFTDSGAAGQNSFKFSGRIGGKGLKPGSYRLVGSTSAARVAAPFTIVR